MASEMDDYEGPKDAGEAFENANLRRMLPELTRFAKVCLSLHGMRERGARRSSVLESEELVNDAIAALLSGERTWIPSLAKTEKGLIAVICMTMKSITANAETSATVAGRTSGERAERHLRRAAEPAPTPEARVAARQELAEIERVVGDDADVTLLIGAYVEGKVRREDIARTLGWKAQKVKVVQNRMRRLLRAKGIAFRDPDEEESVSERTNP